MVYKNYKICKYIFQPRLRSNKIIEYSHYSRGAARRVLSRMQQLPIVIRKRRDINVCESTCGGILKLTGSNLTGNLTLLFPFCCIMFVCVFVCRKNNKKNNFFLKQPYVVDIRIDSTSLINFTYWFHILISRINSLKLFPPNEKRKRNRNIIFLKPSLFLIESAVNLQTYCGQFAYCVYLWSFLNISFKIVKNTFPMFFKCFSIENKTFS